MSDIQQLQRQFAIPGFIAVEAGEGGLARISVTGERAAAHVYLHGAHVTSYRPAGARDLLFVSAKSLFQPGKAIRGGVPVIFPWFGAKADNPAAPQHGFVRATEWTLVSTAKNKDGSAVIVLGLDPSASTRAVWRYEFALRYTVTVGAVLELALEVKNLSATAFTFEEALHTYLAVGNVRKCAVEGLGTREFLDKTDSGRRKTQPAGPIAITGETDRVYLNTGDEVIVDDPVFARRPTVAKTGSQSTVLWNPWVAKAKAMADFGDDEWPGMVCVETANAADNAVQLPPGESHTLRAIISTTGGRTAADAPLTMQWQMTQRK